jgi:hypothetical protein
MEPSTDADPTPALPDLDPGVTLLELDDATDVGALHGLALDRLLAAGGRGLWVDPGRYCPTTTMADLAPSRALLDRVTVARGFTPYQHLRLVDRLRERATDDTAVVVAPFADEPYREGDVRGADPAEMVARAVATLAGVARRHDVPVVLTRERADAVGAPLSAAADRRLTCRVTPHGPRFVGPDAETLVYRDPGDDWVQTTLAFWAAVLATRAAVHHDAAPATGPAVTG